MKHFSDTVKADLLVIKVALFCTLMLFSGSMGTAAFILKVHRKNIWYSRSVKLQLRYI